jgi:hypothetical protein
MLRNEIQLICLNYDWGFEFHYQMIIDIFMIDSLTLKRVMFIFDGATKLIIKEKNICLLALYYD